MKELVDRCSSENIETAVCQQQIQKLINATTIIDDVAEYTLPFVSIAATVLGLLKWLLTED